METALKLTKKNTNVQKHKKKLKIGNIYTKSILSKNVIIDFKYINDNIKKTLENEIKSNIEGKCIPEGYVKTDSCEIISYSSGLVHNGNNIKFEVVFKCSICLPVEGMLIDCVAKNITKAGIKAEIDEDITPVIIFIARDHHFDNENFSSINENDKLTVRVIGHKFELNDKYISVIASLT